MAAPIFSVAMLYVRLDETPSVVPCWVASYVAIVFTAFMMVLIQFVTLVLHLPLKHCNRPFN